MPILKPGEALPSQISETPELYGVKVATNGQMFQERLMEKFGPEQYVEIKNIDDAPLIWQYMPESSERETFDQGGNQRHIYRNQPEQRYILPGESEVIVGASAYRALDVLYKTLAAKASVREYRNPDKPTYDKDGTYRQRSFNFSDTQVQDKAIDHAFLGVVAPTFTRPSEQVSAPAEPTDTTERAWPEPADAPAKAKANTNVAPSR